MSDGAAPERRRSPPPSPAATEKKKKRLLVVVAVQAAVTAAAVFFFFLFAGIAAVVVVHLLMAGSSPARRGRGRGAIWREMKRLPTSRFSIKGGSRAGDCAVCLESFREGDRCRALPRCGHSFHRACVDRWLVVAPLCPVCRTGLREEPGHAVVPLLSS